MKKRLAVAIAALLGVYCLGGCGSKTQQETVNESVQATETVSTVVEEAQSEAVTSTVEEKEVNEIILHFHEDFCNICRDMISEHIMERKGHIYRLK